MQARSNIMTGVRVYVNDVGKPPFGFHPHYGLIAITHPLEGAFDDEDNLSDERHINEKDSICQLDCYDSNC